MTEPGTPSSVRIDAEDIEGKLLRETAIKFIDFFRSSQTTATEITREWREKQKSGTLGETYKMRSGIIDSRSPIFHPIMRDGERIVVNPVDHFENGGYFGDLILLKVDDKLRVRKPEWGNRAEKGYVITEDGAIYKVGYDDRQYSYNSSYNGPSAYLNFTKLTRLHVPDEDLKNFLSIVETAQSTH